MKFKQRHVFWFLVFLGALRLVYLGAKNGDDFLVFWKATQIWIQTGGSPYLPYLPDRGFIYKYPPWIVPLFLPVAIFDENVSRIIWALFELACLAYCRAWVLRQGVSRTAASITLVCFWYIWVAHFHDGQLTLIMLTAALAWEQNRTSPILSPLTAIIFSAKVFSLNTLLGGWQYFVRRRMITAVLAFVSLSTGLVYFVQNFYGNSTSLPELLRAWTAAANSGSKALPLEVVRGGFNQGFTAGIMRILGAGPDAIQLDLMAYLGLTAFLAPLWWYFSKSLKFPERWAGWLALGLIVHPLAWDHSFVMAFPICALALGASLSSKNRVSTLFSILGILFIGALSKNILKDDWVRPLQLISLRSWGVCLSATALILARRTASSKSRIKHALVMATLGLMNSTSILAAETSASLSFQVKVSGKLASKVLIISAAPPPALHFNTEAPTSLIRKKKKKMLAPIYKRSDTIRFAVDSPQAEEYQLNLYVCDQEKTFCKKQSLQLSWDGYQLQSHPELIP